VSTADDAGSTIETMWNSSEHDLQHCPPGERDLIRPSKTDPVLLAALLDEWMRGDEAEQRETFDALT